MKNYAYLPDFNVDLLEQYLSFRVFLIGIVI